MGITGLSGHELEQILRDSGEQRSLTCYRPRSQRDGHHLAAEQQEMKRTGTFH